THTTRPRREQSSFHPRCPVLNTRPPPRSTLSPYTTLFRSVDHPLTAGVQIRDAVAVEIHRDRLRVRGLPVLVGHLRPVRCEPREDRKSTRLNSSHVKISYAVFCLKKKNI